MTVLTDVVECTGCGGANTPGASMCGDCGGPLAIAAAPEQRPRILHPVFGCTCGGGWTCTRCVMYLMDNNLPLDGPLS